MIVKCPEVLLSREFWILDFTMNKFAAAMAGGGEGGAAGGANLLKKRMNMIRNERETKP